MKEVPAPLPQSQFSEDLLCTEAEVVLLVQTFYAEIRKDEQLGPIFEAHIRDWDQHVAKLVDFWSSVLLHTGRFSGNPMAKHAALPNLSEALFQRWLQLFRDNAAAQRNQALGERAIAMAERIAQGLWLGYRKSHNSQY